MMPVDMLFICCLVINREFKEPCSITGPEYFNAHNIKTKSAIIAPVDNVRVRYVDLDDIIAYVNTGEESRKLGEK